MKYGIVVFKDSINIGDDIQSYAASKLLPSVDYYIEREQIDTFLPDCNETVHAIVNGWFSCNKLAWPVSSFINPLYISLHFFQNDELGIGSAFLTGVGREALERHTPIGCRDRETERLLKDAEIDAYYSGCLTLTLKPVFPKNNEKYICLVDVDKETEKHIKQKYPDLKTLCMHHTGDGIVENNSNWNRRFQKVEELLGVYQNAHAVVTTRIHCALPCLALETPVLFLTESTYDVGRLDGLSDLFNKATKKSFIDGEYDYNFYNPPKNPEAYRVLAEHLEERVRDFIENSRSMRFDGKDQLELYYKQLQHNAVWKNNVLYQVSRANPKVYKQMREKDLKEIRELKKQIKHLNNKLNALYESKEYRLGKSLLKLPRRIKNMFQ